MIREKFFDWLERNRWYSKNTIIYYRRTLRDFDEYLMRKKRRSVEACEKICLLDVEWFFRERLRIGNSIKTCNVFLSVIKSYLRYCWIIGKKVMNESAIIRAKEPDNKVECLLDKDCKKLLDYFKWLKANTKREEIINKRNYCICWLLFYTGLRVSELANLKRSQIGNYMQIIWKGNKLRWVNLFEEDLEVINEYLSLRKDKKDDLFISFANNYLWHKLSINAIEKVITEWWEKAWLSERVRPHKLRHTFATNLMRSWVKIQYIQKLLGHKSIATTQIYLTVLNTEVREAQKKMMRF